MAFDINNEETLVQSIAGPVLILLYCNAMIKINVMLISDIMYRKLGATE